MVSNFRGCLSGLMVRALDSGDRVLSSILMVACRKVRGWGVPDDPPSEKSICCRDFGDGVRSGVGLGTLRRLPKAPISLVGHFEGGLQGAKWPKMAKKTTF